MAFRLVALCLVVGALGAASAAGGGVDTATAIVDRTWSCPLHTSDGFRLLGVAGSPGFVDIPQSAAGVTVTDQLAPTGARHVLVSAGSTTIRVHRICRETKRIALTHRGLPEPPDIFQANYDCESKPKAVLIRVRAVVASPGAWKRSKPAHLQLERPVLSAQLTVQMPSGRPIGFLTIAGSRSASGSLPTVSATSWGQASA
jgi:hypothetical protein